MKGPNTEIPPTGHGEKVEREGPALAAGGAPHTSPIPLVQNGGLWGGIVGGIVIVAIAAIALAIIIRRKSRNRKKRDATAVKDGMNKQQRTPLMSSAKNGEFYSLPSPFPVHSTSHGRGKGAHWANG